MEVVEGWPVRIMFSKVYFTHNPAHSEIDSGARWGRWPVIRFQPMRHNGAAEIGGMRGEAIAAFRFRKVLFGGCLKSARLSLRAFFWRSNLSFHLGWSRLPAGGEVSSQNRDGLRRFAPRNGHNVQIVLLF